MTFLKVRTCHKCGETKSLDLFELAKNCPEGRRGTCTKCRNQYRPQKGKQMSDSKGAAIDKLTKHMVDRFLGWRLPEDFQPDNGISFKPTYNGLNGPMKCNPVGTNLFTATQATEMVKYMLDDAILAILAQEVNPDKVDRFEVIDDTGRAYVKGSIYGSPVSVELSYQDDGRRFKNVVISHPLLPSKNATFVALFNELIRWGEAEGIPNDVQALFIQAHLRPNNAAPPVSNVGGDK